MKRLQFAIHGKNFLWVNFVVRMGEISMIRHFVCGLVYGLLASIQFEVFVLFFFVS